MLKNSEITKLIIMWEDHGEEMNKSMYEYWLEVEYRLSKGESFDSATQAPFTRLKNRG